MTTEKLIARDGNRTYSFFLVSKTDALISIDMYNTPYSSIRKNDKWVNYASNKMGMATQLIERL